MRRDETAATRGAGRSVLWLGAHSDDIEIAAEAPLLSLRERGVRLVCIGAKFRNGPAIWVRQPNLGLATLRGIVYSASAERLIRSRPQAPADKRFSVELGRGWEGGYACSGDWKSW